MDDSLVKVFQIALALHVSGLIGMAWGWMAFKKKRQMENTPTSKIRSIAMGLVELYGTVKAVKTVTAPFSKKKCAYYHMSVIENKGTKQRKLQKSIHNPQYFVLDDGTGQVLVKAANAVIEVKPEITKVSSMFPVPKDIKPILKKQGITRKTHLGFTPHLTIEEKIILQGQSVYVHGYAQDNPYVQEGTGQKNEQDIMIGTGEDPFQFFISDEPESKHIKRTHLKAIVLFWAGFATFLFSIAAFVSALLYIF